MNLNLILKSSIACEDKPNLGGFQVQNVMTEQCSSLEWTIISFLSLALYLSFQFQYLNSSINPFIYVIGLHLRWIFTIN